MTSRTPLWLGLLGFLLLVAIVVMSGVGAAYPGSHSPGITGGTSSDLVDVSPDPGMRDVTDLPVVQNEDDEEEYEEDDHEEAEDEAGVTVLGEWWGLGGEAREAPYIGLVELGVIVLALGLGGYMLGKRVSFVPPHYRRFLLPTHEWSMLLGTLLTVPHFFAVEEWEGFGLAVGMLLGLEVLSGLYGRHLHRHVIRFGRGTEPPSVLGAIMEITKETLFSRWRWIHRSLTVLTIVVLLLHIVTAIGE